MHLVGAGPHGGVHSFEGCSDIAAKELEVAKELGSKVRRWHSEKLLSNASIRFDFDVQLYLVLQSPLQALLNCISVRNTQYLMHAGCSLSKKDFRPISSAQLPASLLGALYKLQQSFCLSDPNLPDMPIVHASEGFMKLTGRPRYKLLSPISCSLTEHEAFCASLAFSSCLQYILG